MPLIATLQLVPSTFTSNNRAASPARQDFGKRTTSERTAGLALWCWIRLRFYLLHNAHFITLLDLEQVFSNRLDLVIAMGRVDVNAPDLQVVSIPLTVPLGSLPREEELNEVPAIEISSP